MRSLLVEYAHAVNPNIAAAEVGEMIDALAGDPIMGEGCTIQPPKDGPRPIPQATTHAAKRAANGAVHFFADSSRGSDTNAGTEDAPFRTVARAVEAVRAEKAGGGVVTLRAGIFYIGASLELGAEDSGLTIETHPEDAPNLAYLSGATPLTNVTWKAVNTSAGANLWAADLSQFSHFLQSAKGVTGMRLNGRRLWQARYPNGDPERTFPFNTMDVVGSKWMTTPGSFPPASTYETTEPCGTRNDTVGRDTAYTMRMGGSACAKYTPPISYYCGSSSDAGGGVVIPQKSLPNQPYKRGAAGATVTAMHGGRWCSFAYHVGSDPEQGGYQWDDANKEGTFTFFEGGQQCNRPEGAHGQLIIEGVLDELDEAGEFHFDPATKVLTLWHNATSGTMPPTDGSLEILTSLSVLVNATGSQNAPVRDLTFDRVGFRDTAPTVFAPHLAPTGGDWAVNRHAALSVTGAVGLNVSRCSFWRLDNAGVFLGGYHRNATIADNSFAWIGESSIVSVGDTRGAGLDPELYPGFGCDGAAGDQPRGTRVLRNFARELGIINKQSAFYFQAATSSSYLEGNVAFNGARSGINFNDAFGDGSTVTRNVLFNMNRETADHGPFNSWDRLPFSPSRNAQHRDLIELNFILSNFNSYNGLDTDDDSAYFHMKDNVLLYGHMLKSDFSGHSIEYDGVLGVFVGPSNQYQPVPTAPELLNVMHDTTIISKDAGDFFGLTDTTCATALNGSASDFPNVYDTVVYTASGSTTVCRKNISELQAKGKLKNVTAEKLTMSAADIVAAAAAKLKLDF